MNDYLKIARRVIRDRERPPGQVSQTPLETALNGQAIELLSAAERLFLVADEDDARMAMESFEARRGEIYTAPEARRIIAVNDPAAVAEIHEWKRQFDGRLSDHRPQKRGSE